MDYRLVLTADNGKARFYEVNSSIKEGMYGSLETPSRLVLVYDADARPERMVFAVGLDVNTLLTEGDGDLFVDWSRGIANHVSLVMRERHPFSSKGDRSCLKKLLRLNR